jgi:hypothetical protein
VIVVFHQDLVRVWGWGSQDRLCLGPVPLKPETPPASVKVKNAWSCASTPSYLKKICALSSSDACRKLDDCSCFDD